MLDRMRGSFTNEMNKIPCHKKSGCVFVCCMLTLFCAQSGQASQTRATQSVRHMLRWSPEHEYKVPTVSRHEKQGCVRKPLFSLIICNILSSTTSNKYY